MFFRPFRSRSRAAFSLIEAAIVLGIVGLVIGGIWVAAASVRERMRINALLEAVGTTYANIQMLYKGQAISGITQITGDILEVVAPKGMVRLNQLADPWNHSIAVEVVNGAVPYVRFWFDMHIPGGLDPGYCLKMAPRFGSQFRVTNLAAGAIPSVYAGDDSGALHSPELASATCPYIQSFYVHLPL